MPIITQPTLETRGHPQMGGLFSGLKLINRTLNKLVAAIVPATATDDFNRSNSDPVSNPMSDGISQWQSGTGAVGEVRIVSNALNRSLATQSGARVSSPSFSNNQQASITLSGTATGCGVVVRVQSSTNFSCYLLYASSTTSLQFYRVTDSGSLSLTQLGGNVTIAALTAGDIITLRIIGDTLEALVNGVSTSATRTDSTYSSGQPGVYFGGANSIDMFTASDI